MKSRDVGIDVLKAFLAFLVIFGHILQIGIANGDTNEYTESMKYIIYSFHMPLFAFVSGYYSTAKQDYVGFCKNKFKQLILPILFWGSIIVLFNILVLNINNITTLKGFILYDLWYLKSLFVILSLSWFYIRYLSPYYLLFFIAISLYSGGILMLALLVPSFMLGFCYRRYYESRLKKYIFSFSLFLLGIEYFFVCPSLSVDNLNFIRNLDANASIVYFHRMILALSACIVVFSLFKCIDCRLKNKKSIVWLGKIGKQSLAIYTIQSLLVEKIVVFIIQGMNMFQYIILSVLAYCLVFLIILILSKFIVNENLRLILGIK